MYLGNTTLFLIIAFVLNQTLGLNTISSNTHQVQDDSGSDGDKDMYENAKHQHQHRKLQNVMLDFAALRAPYETVQQLTNGTVVVTNIEPWKEIKTEKKIKSAVKKITKSIPLQEGMSAREETFIRKGYTKLLKKGDSALQVGDLLYRASFQVLLSQNVFAFTVISVATEAGLIKFDAVLDSILVPPQVAGARVSAAVLEAEQAPECVLPQDADEEPISDMNGDTMEPAQDEEEEVGGGGVGAAAEEEDEAGEGAEEEEVGEGAEEEEAGEGAEEEEVGEGAEEEVGAEEVGAEEVGGAGEDGLGGGGVQEMGDQGFNRRRLDAPEGLGYREWKNVLGVVKAWGKITVRALASNGCDADFTASFQASAAFPFVAEPRAAEPHVTVCCAEKADCECTKEGQVIRNAMECGQSSKTFSIVGRLGLSWLSADIVNYPGEVQAWVCADGASGEGNF